MHWRIVKWRFKPPLLATSATQILPSPWTVASQPSGPVHYLKPLSAWALGTGAPRSPLGCYLANWTQLRLQELQCQHRPLMQTPELLALAGSRSQLLHVSPAIRLCLLEATFQPELPLLLHLRMSQLEASDELHLRPHGVPLQEPASNSSQQHPPCHFQPPTIHLLFLEGQPYQCPPLAPVPLQSLIRKHLLLPPRVRKKESLAIQSPLRQPGYPMYRHQYLCSLCQALPLLPSMAGYPVVIIKRQRAPNWRQLGEHGYHLATDHLEWPDHPHRDALEHQARRRWNLAPRTCQSGKPHQSRRPDTLRSKHGFSATGPVDAARKHARTRFSPWD